MKGRSLAKEGPTEEQSRLHSRPFARETSCTVDDSGSRCRTGHSLGRMNSALGVEWGGGGREGTPTGPQTERAPSTSRPLDKVGETYYSNRLT